MNKRQATINLQQSSQFWIGIWTKGKETRERDERRGTSFKFNNLEFGISTQPVQSSRQARLDFHVITIYN